MVNEMEASEREAEKIIKDIFKKELRSRFHNMEVKFRIILDYALYESKEFFESLTYSDSIFNIILVDLETTSSILHIIPPITMEKDKWTAKNFGLKFSVTGSQRSGMILELRWDRVAEIPEHTLLWDTLVYKNGLCVGIRILTDDFHVSFFKVEKKNRYITDVRGYNLFNYDEKNPSAHLDEAWNRVRYQMMGYKIGKDILLTSQ